MVRGRYLYGFLRAEVPARFGRSGLFSGRATVYTLADGQLAALLSCYRGPELRSLARPEVLRCLAIHQQVLEQVMKGHTVLPAKFGTVLASDAEALTLLRGWRRPLAAALRRFQDVVEMEVTAIWEPQQTFVEIAAEPEVAALKGAIEAGVFGDALEERVRLGKMVKEALDRRRACYLERVMAVLRGVAIDSVSQPLLSDEMALQVGCLVPQQALRRFHDALDAVDGHFAGGLNFRCVGPLPPYSFGLVSVLRLRPAELADARRALALAEGFTEREVTAAYRRRAAQHHPDTNPGDPGAPARFTALTQDYGRLLAYCRGRPPEAELATTADEGGEPGPHRARQGRLLLTIGRAPDRASAPAVPRTVAA